MTPQESTVKVRYTGDYPGATSGVGFTEPGAIVELPKEYGEALAFGQSLFELIEAPAPEPSIVKKAVKKVSKKKKEEPKPEPVEVKVEDEIKELI